MSTDPKSSHPHRSGKPMRSRSWSAPWFRLFLSLIVLGAGCSSPIRVVSPFFRAARRPAQFRCLRRNFATVNKQQTGSPVEVRRVRFLHSLEDPSDEIALDKSLLTWTFSILSLLTQCQWPLLPSSLPFLQSSPPLRC
jgi:hypothetical protein